MKKDNGSLTLEASIVLFIFLVFFLFFLSFAKYSAVQNKVKHSLNQTAISMSLRNNQLVKIANIINNAAGISQNNIAEWMKYFTNNNELSIKLGTPYTLKAEDKTGKEDNIWNDNDLKREVIRMFAYYYIDLSFSDSDRLSYEDIQKKLSQAGLMEVEITGGNNGMFLDKNELSIVITYKIKTGLSFHSIFGITDDMKFTDSICTVLME